MLARAVKSTAKNKVNAKPSLANVLSPKSIA